MRKSWLFFLCFYFLFSPIRVYSSKNNFLEKNSSDKSLVIIGDSISEGYGVPKEKSYPSLLEKKIQNKNWKIINSSISGSTTASLQSRVKWVLKTKPNLILLALGGNDALRGLAISDTKKNLEEAIVIAKKENVKIILVGMYAPMNYGKKYSQEFGQIYQDLSKRYKLKCIPFILQDVVGREELNQPDHIHPNEKGHQVISENIYQIIKDEL